MTSEKDDRPAPPSGAPTLSSPGSNAGDRRSGSSSDNDGLPAGHLIGGRFRIVGQLGSGGMGEVYRADDLELGSSVALKFLPTALACDVVRLEHLRNEVRVARQVAHPNVCRVYDIGDAEGRPFLSMEYIDGEDLASLLRRIGRLPRDKAIDLAREICAGIAAAHELEVIHRDLKPANIMIDGRGRARVADFGLASGKGGLVGVRNAMAGTPVYMAPEQLTGSGASKQTDIYALGLVLYEVFTGKRVHDVKSIVELKEQHASSAPPTSPSELIDGMDPRAEHVIMQCLAPDPDDRPQSALAVMAALPGGDPLTAMVRAGEIPSPELVAASGRRGTLSSSKAKQLGVFILAGLLVSLWLYGRFSFVDAVGGVLPPEVLSHRALNVLVQLGREPNITDSAWGHDLDWDLGSMMSSASTEERFALLRSDERPPLRFWYRSSPETMIPWNVSLPGVWAGNIVTLSDPPLTVEGMTLVRLGPQGHLIELRAVPGPARESSAPQNSADLIETAARAAGMDPAAIEAAPWSGNLPMPGSPTTAWLVTDRSPTVEPRIIVMTTNSGKPTWLRVMPTAAPADSPSPTRAQDPLKIVFVFFFVVGAILAAHNVRQGHWDRRGSIRLATAAFVLCFASEVVGSHHSFAPSGEAHGFFASVAYASTRGLMTWLLYVAIEPFIRRLHPRSLVSWSRLLTGRVTDPAVGRDVLVGLTALAAMTLVLGVWYAGRGLHGSILPYWAFVGGQTPLDTASFIAMTIRILVVSVGSALGFLLIYVVLRRLCGGLTRLATLLFWILLFGFFFTTYFAVIQTVDLIVYAFVSAAGCAYLAVRHGLLALATTSFFANTLMFTVLTLDPTSWYFPPTAITIALIAALALFGIRVSAHRTVFRPTP